MSASAFRSRVGRGLATVLIGVPVILTSCSGGDSYEEFRSALRAKASCRELFDQRGNFEDGATVDKIDADLEEIGCDSPSSERSDI